MQCRRPPVENPEASSNNAQVPAQPITPPRSPASTHPSRRRPTTHNPSLSLCTTCQRPAPPVLPPVLRERTSAFPTPEFFALALCAMHDMHADPQPRGSDAGGLPPSSPLPPPSPATGAPARARCATRATCAAAARAPGVCAGACGRNPASETRACMQRSPGKGSCCLRG